MADDEGRDPRATVAVAQGLYSLVTGIWPLVDLRSFEAISGPKVDGWLVKTVGALVAVTGGVLLSAAKRERITPEIAALGAGTAVALGTIDVVYVARRRISPVYLLDAALEGVFLVGWFVGRRR
jgi:hypothetical protein